MLDIFSFNGFYDFVDLILKLVAEYFFLSFQVFQLEWY